MCQQQFLLRPIHLYAFVDKESISTHGRLTKRTQTVSNSNQPVRLKRYQYEILEEKRSKSNTSYRDI